MIYLFGIDELYSSNEEKIFLEMEETYYNFCKKYIGGDIDKKL